MVKYFNSIIIMILFMFFGCGGDSSTDPVDNDPPIDNTPLITQEIGPTGGTISTEDLEISFPSNSLPSSSSISVYQSTTEFSSSTVSGAYQITGIPQNYSKGFTIRLKHSGSISGSPYMAVGSNSFTPSANDFEIGYSFFEARDSAGFLCADIPIIGDGTNNSGKNRNVTNNIEMEMEAVVAMETMSSNNHFKIFHHYNVLNSAINLGEYLEDAYTRYAQMGFDFQAQLTSPIEVVVRNLDDEIVGLYKRFRNEWLEFNQMYINNSTEMKTTAAHEFMHIVQEKYDSRSWVSKTWGGNGPQYWLDEATAVWAESMFSNETNYISGARDGHEMAPYYGMQKGAQSNPGHHGYGMSSMIKFLADADPGVVKNIYDKIKTGNSPVQAITSSVATPVADWWPLYLSYNTLGYLYDDLPTARIISDNETETFTIASPDDTLRTFSTTTTDLSGKFYDFKLTNPSFTSTSMLNLTLNAPSHTTLIVYTYKGSTINYLGYSQTSFPVYGLKALKDESWHILALVVDSRLSSPYTGTSSLNLEARVTRPLFDFSLIKYAEVIVNCEVHLDSTATGKGSSWKWEYVGFPSVEGSFNGNTFTADHQNANLYEGGGTVSVTIDPINFRVNSYNATWNSGGNYNLGIIGTGLPFISFTYSESGDANGLAFVVGPGDETCNSISNFYENWSDEDNGYISDGFRCTEQSWVGVYLFWEKPEDY